MKHYLEWLTLTKEYQELEKGAAENKTCFAFGLYTEKIYMAALLCERLKKRAFIIVPDEESARKAHDFLSTTAGGSCVFPPKDYNFRAIESSSRFVDNTRIETLAHIRRHDRAAIIIPAQALSGLVPSPADYKELHLERDSTFPFEELPQRLTELGYERFSTVEGAGQFAVRGGIVDIFPPSEEVPYRIEFFGDDIDSIYIFDINTQRRTEQKDDLTVTPARERSEAAIEKILKAVEGIEDNEFINEDRELLTQGIIPAHDRYLPLMYDSPASILDYVEDNDILMMWDYRECLNGIDGAEFRITEDIKAMTDEGCVFPSKDYFINKSLVLEKIKNPLILGAIPVSINEFLPEKLLEFKVRQTEFLSLALFEEEAAALIKEGYEVCAVAPDSDAEEKLRQDMGGLSIQTAVGNLPCGYILPDVKKAVFEFRQKAVKKKKRKSKYKKGEYIKSFSDIQKGDYVVHTDFGIGMYDGIHKVENRGTVKDYIKILYKGTDVVYIPCDQLNMISKYNSGGEGTPKIKLSSLGSNEWQKTKSHVKKAVRDLADKLILLYGERLRLPGHAFAPDNEWQRDFEADFEFEETEDQLKAIADIKQDMETPRPMDRLLCGDVGFGKTEVALRAIFKCVMDGKQAALLAPTTILAYQHYQTMLKRFKKFPVSVEMLSRFRSKKQLEAAVSDLKKGKTDVVVGTHRLVSKDVQFKDLGLIVIDEEQRFGVAHKEHLKELSKSADVLTLTATPIPRTLNMSLSGIRDISMLTEAPQNRYPITTYIAEHDMGIVADAIKREVYRGGQCFYLYNKVETIYKVASEIEKATGVRVSVAHGKMSKSEIADVWQELVDGETDVLVCTTIIETGVDVPNCNTLIVEDADKLGLSQLHQIRGRVGRTNKRAYAYFLYRKGKTLSEDAYKRLMTIREFTEFGSGLKIAMRDLEIRGAGDILGAEQSGHMLSVGYDMYMQLLEEAVGEKRGILKPKTQCRIELKVSAYIPDSYIKSADTRIEIYKLIAAIENEADKSDVIDELIDRFGDPPKEVMNLLEITMLRVMGAESGVTEVTQKDNTLLFMLEKEPEMPFIAEVTSNYPPRSILFSAGTRPYFSLKTDSSTLMADAKKLLNFLQLSSQSHIN